MAPQRGGPETPSEVLANTTFRTWTSLSDSSRKIPPIGFLKKAVTVL
jgi:hypothetical protein